MERSISHVEEEVADDSNDNGSDEDGNDEEKDDNEINHDGGGRSDSEEDTDEYESDGIDDSRAPGGDWREMLAEFKRDHDRARLDRAYYQKARKPQLQRRKRPKKDKKVRL